MFLIDVQFLHESFFTLMYFVFALFKTYLHKNIKNPDWSLRQWDFLYQSDVFLKKKQTVI